MKSPIDVNDAVLCEVSFTEADELSSLPWWNQETAC
jgi:hypothetical protein